MDGRAANARLVDPGLARKPGMIGVAYHAARAREEDGAAPEALAISLDAGGNRHSGLRTFDHDHTHVILPYECRVVSCK